ncbi:hypothetical protein [Okeania sp. SIO3B5]|nr:hypothetical protein [Okeania sp. SIO3B5]
MTINPVSWLLCVSRADEIGIINIALRITALFRQMNHIVTIKTL